MEHTSAISAQRLKGPLAFLDIIYQHVHRMLKSRHIKDWCAILEYGSSVWDPSSTVHAAKCYDQSRLITWNFESHVTFLRGFCVDIMRKYREFCVERADRT